MATNRSTIPTPPRKTRMNVMPPETRDGKMPEPQRTFSRLANDAQRITPNPAEKMERTWHGVTPPRFVGNFNDRKTPNKIANLPKGGTHTA